MKRTFKEYLLEAPLPDDWDANIYNERISFAKRIAYAKQKAQKIGTGSSRVAFKIPYQGRDTVLKIAKNTKGMAQNEKETELFNDHYLNGLDIVIPMIDYDERSSSPTWIHTEFANKAKDSDFKRACGGSLQDLAITACKSGAGTSNQYCRSFSYSSPKNNVNEESELYDSFQMVVGNYDLPVADLARLANWGIYSGRPVIIDLGLTTEVFNTHYSR